MLFNKFGSFTKFLYRFFISKLSSKSFKIKSFFTLDTTFTSGTALTIINTIYSEHLLKWPLKTLMQVYFDLNLGVSANFLTVLQKSAMFVTLPLLSS